ncbi:MAG TPA: hypothetical protein VG096_19685 [Bryobacteraceae bacterium]|jgi:hypothetical protein|nr:hypothetical protein [Bryobacteraceae bacterium]
MADGKLTREEWLAMLEADAGAGLENVDLSDRDRASLILDRLDYGQQLTAITGLLARNKAADKQLEAERREIVAFIKKSSGSTQEHAIDESGENFYAMVYQGAAHSMAALGMIAPMYESMFIHAFQSIREVFRKTGASLPAHARDGIAKSDNFWDCHLVYNENARYKTRPGLVEGIIELANATDWTLPAGLESLLEALFAYRNKMFHCGFEWPKDECLKFAKLIEEKNWDGWFDRSEHGEEPWIFYMSDDFIKGCLEMIDKVLDAFGQYCKHRLPVVPIPVQGFPLA